MTDLERFLQQTGLTEYLQTFRAAEVTDLETLRQLSDVDLRDELGLPLGVRRRILQALHGESGAGGERGEPALSRGDCPGELHPADLPTFVAHPWHGYCAHDHPRERLYWLVDTIEASAGLATALALAAFTADDEALPAGVAARVRHLVHRPTLGQWLQLLRTLTGADERPEAGTALLEAVAAVAARFDAYCPTGEAGGDPDRSLLAMRNALAHGGGFSRDRAAHYVATHEPAVVDVLATLNAALADAELIGSRGEGYVRLWGPTPQACETPGVALAGHGPWLVDADGAWSLDPLLAFASVRRRARDGRLTVLADEPVGQLYASAERQALRYTPVGVDAVVSEAPEATARLRALFRLDEAPPASAAEAHGDTVDGYHWHGFLQEARLLADGLIGRAAELDTLKGWLKERRGRGDDEARIGWVPGAPGVGKSQLMARIAADLDNGNALATTQVRDTAVYYHRFRAGDARNSTRHFLRLLRAALDAWPQLAAAAPAGEAGADEGEALVRDVRARLEAIAELEPASDKAPPPRLVVLVDGLDELARYDATIAALIHRLAVPATVWLVAGRRDAGLDDAFTAWPAEPIYPEGLPAMRDADIRAMLLENLGPLRYELLERDTDTDAGELPHNPFVDAVVENADGLPLYVHLLLDDLERGRLRPSDEHSLPPGVESYYGTLLDQLAVGDSQRALPLLLSALAVSDQPVPLAKLSELIAVDDRRTVVAETDRALAEQVLRSARNLVRSSASPDAEIAYTLYHATLRDYLRYYASDWQRPVRAARRHMDRLSGT